MPAPLDGHWCAFFIPHRGGVLEFFDAFDKDPNMYSEEFRRFIAKHNGYAQMPRPIQCYDSSACGPHCLQYLYYRLQGKPINWIYLKIFQPGCRKNDRSSYDFVFNIIKSFPISFRRLFFKDSFYSQRNKIKNQ